MTQTTTETQYDADGTTLAGRLHELEVRKRLAYHRCLPSPLATPRRLALAAMLLGYEPSRDDDFGPRSRALAVETRAIA